MRDIRELFPADDPVRPDPYAIALRVARGQRPYSGTPSSGARRALSTMERAGIAEHHGRGDWLNPEPLLRRYLATRP